MILIKNIRRFVALDGDQSWLLTESVLLLFVAKFLLLILPVKAVMKITLSSKKAKKQPDPNLLRQIKWALYNADRLSLWKNRCLVQSIAGRWMLQHRKIPSQIFFGVKHENIRKIVAHAWLKAGDFEIVEKGDDYRELTHF